MKVGGNASASEFFSKNGGAAALNSKEAKVKYTSRAAVAYKDELKRRAAFDAKVHPDTVIADDINEIQEENKRMSEDFFESWDKPIVHKPTPPPSRTATPPVPAPLNGTPSSGKSRTPTQSSPAVKSTGPRITTSSALRSSKSTSTAGIIRTGAAGTRKSAKPAIKKISDPVSFEEAEKAATEEAERIKKWGIDGTELKRSETARPALQTNAALSSLSSKTSETKPHADVERLGMGVQRLGFGMISNDPPKPATTVKAATSISLKS